jgi:biopolymer transport protein ExbD
MGRRATPEVNAGSMADIAFLLLIFFLVTTTIEKDKGIARQLPPLLPPDEEPIKFKEKNIFIVNVNKDNQLLVENDLMDISKLRQSAIDFIDNGGDGTCTFCKGLKDLRSSDNPNKAVISVQNDRNTAYKTYIAVQNELVAAYNFLRDRESQRMFGWKYTEVMKGINEGSFNGDEDAVMPKIKEIREMIPLNLSEAEAKKSES